MKKISAAFDGLKFSEGTLTYAIKLAENSKALLSGVFLESFLYHSYGIYDMVGSQGVSETKMKRLRENDEETRRKAAAAFESACEKAGISFAIHHDKNFALQELIRESIYSDLVLIGADENMSHVDEKAPTNFIRDFLAETQSPVLIVPRQYHEIEKVVLLYDGKPSSVHAIKMFNYMLPWMCSKETEIISVTDPKEARELPDENLVREFIQCHYPKAVYTLLQGDPEEEILDYLKNTPQNVLVVLGAYQRGNVSRWFKTSMADLLMKNTGRSLFIAHQK